MLTESVILSVLVVTMCYFTLRSGGRGTVLALLPLLIVPGANILAYGLAPQLDKLSEALSASHWRILFVLGALVVTMGLVGGISRNIKNKGPRRAYLCVCGGFSFLFSFLILVSALPNL